jgi:hypothetical protein
LLIISCSEIKPSSSNKLGLKHPSYSDFFFTVKVNDRGFLNARCLNSIIGDPVNDLLYNTYT